MKNKLKAPIVEVFTSIQGEGPSIGHPVVFVRFYGCNLRCKFSDGRCDTPYAVFTEEDKVKFMDVQILANVIRKFPFTHIVFTGGEPTLYQDYIVKLIDELRSEDDIFTFEVETNGTINISDSFRMRIDWFNISLKLKSSRQENKKMDKLRINDVAIKTFPVYKSCFKFVVSTQDDIDEIEVLSERYSSIPVYLMPLGETREEQLKNMSNVAEWCMIHGWNMSFRAHILLWDKKRGV